MKRTVGRLIQWSVEYLAEKGIDTPRLDSEVLLAHILNIDRTKLYIDLQKFLSSREHQIFKELIQRRVLREPLHYITGIKEFWSLHFKVNRYVLIPRPETEILVQKTLDILKGHYSSHAGLVYINEIGTGCGNIAISLSKERENLFIIATDNSEEALSIAADNARLNNINNQICFQKRELFGEHKSNAGIKIFNLIVSNPPYIPTEDIKSLAPEIKNYEPRAALDGGPDGLYIYRKIIAQIPDYLNKGGFVVFEMGYNQGKAISQMLQDTGYFSEIEITKDYSGKDRVISARFNPTQWV